MELEGIFKEWNELSNEFKVLEVISNAFVCNVLHATQFNEW